MSNLHESYRQKLTVTQDLVVDPALRSYLGSPQGLCAKGRSKVRTMNMTYAAR